MRYTDPATGEVLGVDPDDDELDVEAPPARTAPGNARRWVTMVSLEHGSFLTCAARLGCTDPDHKARRRAYHRAVKERYNRRIGVRPYEETHPRKGHGEGPAAYRRCTDGPDGTACQPCKDTEAARQRRIRETRQ